jgi:cytochrome bd ubiquinol oxidase subunit II
MDLPLLSALFAAFALALYVMLDGFDLGVGVMLLAQPDERLRDRMVDSITPTWDGNETWLIMAGVALLAPFPTAYSILLLALYLPLIAMLLALGLRGVSFEFCIQVDSRRRLWDWGIGIGSLVAAAMQGVIVGGLVQGVAVDGERFGGSVFDVFRPFSLLVGAAVLAGYVALGGGWLHLKTMAALRSFAERALRFALPAFVGLAAATCIGAAVVQPAIGAAWSIRFVPLLSATVLFLVAAVGLMRAVGGRSDARPFTLALALFACGVAGLGFAIFPDIVPFHLSLWARGAMAHHLSSWPSATVDGKR